MSRTVAVIVALGLLAACGKGDGDLPQGTKDTRIDGASSDNDPDSHSMRMCVNRDGHVYVVWVDDRDGTSDIWLNRSTDLGASWLPTPVKINRGEDSSVFAPAIACTNQAVFVVWEDNRDGELENHQIYFSRSLDNGETWSADDLLLELDEEGRTMSLGPQIVAVGTDVHVTWYDSQNGAYDIFVASSIDNGQSFRAPVRVDSDGPGDAYSAAPQIAATESGNVYVTWEDSRNGEGESDIYFARSENSGNTFREDRRLDLGDTPGSNASFAPRIGADGNDVYVVWHDARNGVGRDVYLNYSGNGGADWRPEAVRVNGETAGFFNSLYPDVAVRGGEAHVAWQDARNEVYDIYYRRILMGDPAGEDVRIDTGDGAGLNNSVNARIAMGDGAVVIAWEDYRGEAVAGTDAGYIDLHYNYDDGSGFKPDQDFRIDSMPPGFAHKYDLAVAVHGGWLLSAWVDNRNLNDDVYFHALRLGDAAEFVEQQ